MDKKEEPVSPEEKLLKVIQQGKAKPEPAAEPVPPKVIPKVAAKPVPVAPVAAAAPREPPKIKLATPQKKEPTPAAAAAAEHAARPTATAGLIGVGPAPGLKKKRRKQMPLLVGLNRLLAGIAAAVMLLTAWEIWANVQQSEIDRTALGGMALIAPGEAPAPVPGAAAAVTQADATELAKVQKDFEERPLFAAARRLDGSVTNVVTTVVSQADWEAYARKNLKLKGLSSLPSGEMEAILMDASTGKLQYLKPNDQMLVDKRNIKVEAIDKESIVVTDGLRKLSIK